MLVTSFLAFAWSANAAELKIGYVQVDNGNVSSFHGW